LYTGCDGITRFRRFGPPTTTLSRLVEVTRSMTMERVSTKDWKPLELVEPVCQLPEGERLCQPNVPNLNYGPGNNSIYNLPDGDTGVGFYDGVPRFYNFCRTLPGICALETLQQEVVLLYWSQNASTNTCNPTQTFTQSGDQQPVRSAQTAVLEAITFRGQDLYRARETIIGVKTNTWDPEYVSMSVMKGPFTFTSPFIYLAYRPMTFAHFGGIISDILTTSLSTRSAGILTLRPTDMSSLVPAYTNYQNETEYASLVANGKFTKNEDLIYERLPPKTMPFNFADLQDPVPARAYFDARTHDCWGKQSHCGTITDDSYRPRLLVASKLWSTFKDSSCEIPDLVDPPMVLSAIDDESPEKDPPLPAIPQGPSRVDWDIPASATAMNVEWDTSLPLEPGPIPTRLWPFPTATSGSTSGNMRGENSRLGFTPPGDLKDTHSDAKGRDRHGASYNDAAAVTSGSRSSSRESMIEKWRVSLTLSLFFFAIAML
jgi:hypothetical protein